MLFLFWLAGACCSCASGTGGASPRDLGLISDGLIFEAGTLADSITGDVGIDLIIMELSVIVADSGDSDADAGSLDAEAGGPDADAGGSICGNWILEPGEDCELPFHVCCDTLTCRFKAAGTLCRVTAGDCDVEETCDGQSVDCPKDMVKNKGRWCRAAANECDEIEYCNGTSPQCPPDKFKPNGTQCNFGICISGECN